MAENDRATGLVGYSGVKVPVRAASTGVLTLSGEQTIDGVACVSGDRVLVKNQASGIDNGIYVVDTGSWSRASDCDGSYDLVSGSLIPVFAGTVNARAVYQCATSGTITIGTTSLTFTAMGLLSAPVPIGSGGTGATSAISALSALGVIQVTAEGGTANAQTGTIDALVTALRADQLFIHIPSVTNTGALTVNYTPAGGAALGAKSVLAGGAALGGGEFKIGVPALLQYDGASLNLLNPQQATAAASNTDPRLLENVSFTATANSPANALTIALTGADDNTPSASNVAKISFRSATITAGGSSKVSVVAATTTTISNGSTGGTSNGVASRIWVAAILVAGAVELAWINVGATGTSVPVEQGNLITTTAEGGAGAADSANVWYSTTARASVPFTILGYFESTQAAAGTWVTAPAKLVVNPAEPPKNRAYAEYTANADLATAIPLDDTIPQITEGTEVLTVTITPRSLTSRIRVRFTGFGADNTGTRQAIAALFQDAVANALKAVACWNSAAANQPYDMSLEYEHAPATLSAITYRLRVGMSANTLRLNGNSAGRWFGGVASATLVAEEISI